VFLQSSGIVYYQCFLNIDYLVIDEWFCKIGAYQRTTRFFSFSQDEIPEKSFDHKIGIYHDFACVRNHVAPTEAEDWDQ
jgi:hypothetical protein